MSSEGVSAGSVRLKVSSGYGRLDEALGGGFVAGSAVVLTAPASDEVPLLLRGFLTSGAQREKENLLICRSSASADAAGLADTEGVRILVCGETIQPSGNLVQGVSVENLTELNLQIAEVLKSVQPKRVAVDVLSDVLLRHKALQTRKWVAELLARLRSKDITALAVINPNMHTKEEVEAIIDLFDGSLEIQEKLVEGQLTKIILIRWMHGVDVTEKEIPLGGLIREAPAHATSEVQSAVSVVPFKEPRWLTPLIDRTQEVSKLRSALEDSLAQKSSLVALQGEAGVGKTRLIRELAVYAQTKGVVVLVGRGAEDGFAYGPWIELAREYVAQASGETLRRMLGVHLPDFGRVVPDIAAKVGTIPPSKPLGDQEDRFRLYEAVTQFLVSISKEKPLLLLIDDMQHIDQASINLLEYFIRNSSGFRILTVCCYNTEAVEPNSSLYKTLMKLNKERLLETIQIKNLNRDDAAKLIAEIFGEREITAEFGDLIYQRTGGNPFFVEEVLRSLVEDGTIFRTEKGWDRKPIQELVVPESVKATLRSRLTKLTPEIHTLLQWAAMEGSEFDFEVVREVAHVDEDTLLQRIETAYAAGLVTEAPQRKGMFRFVDKRIRELLLGDLIQVRRARYHLKIAEAMEKVYAKSLDRQAEAIASHFSDGGDTPRGIKYSIMAGDRNRALHAYEQAISNYRRALDLLDLDEGNEQGKALVLEKLADAYRLAAQFQDAAKCYEKSLAIFDRLKDAQGCARACEGLADAIWGRKGTAATQEYEEVLKRGLKHLEEAGLTESSEAASIYSSLARYLGLVDEWDEANMWAEKAMEAGEKTNNFGAVAVALSQKASYLTDTGNIDEGLPLWERTFEVALQHEEFEEALFDLLNLSIYTYPRDLTRARDLALRLLELSKRVNHIQFEGIAWGWLSRLDWHAGDWITGREEIDRRFEIEKRIGIKRSGSFSARGWFFLGIGELDKAEADLGEGVGLADASEKITWRVYSHLSSGLLRLEQGRDDDARTHFEICVNAFRKWEFTTDPLVHIETLLHLTEIYAKSAEFEKAREYAQWGKRLAEQLRSNAGLAMALQAEATLLSSQGQGKTAQETYRKSLQLWEKAGWPYYRAKTLVAYADALAEISPDQAGKSLEQASAIFRKLGAKRDLEKTLTKLSARK